MVSPGRFHVRFRLGGLHRPLGGEAGDGEDGALGRLHHRLVGGGNTLLHSGGKVPGGGGLLALEALGEAPEQQGEDDAGVAPGPPEEGGGGEIRRLGQRSGLGFPQFRHGGADGHGHVGPGVSVRHGEDVQVVDGLLLSGDGGGPMQDHLLEKGAGDLFIHLSRSSLIRSWSPRTRLPQTR